MKNGKGKSACPGCGGPFKQTRAALLLVTDAGIPKAEPALVCSDCATRGVLFVFPEARSVQRASLAPFAYYFRRLALAFPGSERAEGLRQAADVLLDGRVPSVPPAVQALGEDLAAAAPKTAKHAEPIKAAREPRAATDERDLWPAEEAIVRALKRYGGPRTLRTLGDLTGYQFRKNKPSGTFSSAIARLKRRGFLIGGSGSVDLTPEGSSVAGTVDRLPDGAELLEHYGSLFGACAQAILARTASLFPNAPASVEELCELTGYALKGGKPSGTFSAALATCRRMRLIQGIGATKLLMAQLEAKGS